MGDTSSNVIQLPNAAKAAKRKAKDLWSAEVLDVHGYSMVPRLLLWGQGTLGIEPNELNVLLQLISHRWTADNDPHPSKETIAQRMGRDPRRVQEYLTSLEKKGFITRIARFKPNKGQEANAYSLDGLLAKLKEIAPAFAKVKEQNKIRRSRVEKPAAVKGA